MVDAFTKRNHYNPCFWTALWNRGYFEDWTAGRRAGEVARDQSIFTLNIRADKILPTKVANVHYEKDLGVAEITPESMKRFCRRWHPQEYERLSAYVDSDPKTLYVDFEDILAGIEKLGVYSPLMRSAKIGGVESTDQKAFLACALVIHAMRSHEFMTGMLDGTPAAGIEKWEYFWLLKNAWANPLILARAVIPLGMGRWTLYRTVDHRFPLCDSPIMIDRDTLMAVLSPRLLLEIDLTIPCPVDHWIVRNDISSTKYKEFRRRAIANSFKDILFHEPTVLAEWQSLREYRERVARLSDPSIAVRCVHEAASRVIWAMGGFDRVPDDFESWAAKYINA